MRKELAIKRARESSLHLPSAREIPSPSHSVPSPPHDGLDASARLRPPPSCDGLAPAPAGSSREGHAAPHRPPCVQSTLCVGRSLSAELRNAKRMRAQPSMGSQPCSRQKPEDIPANRHRLFLRRVRKRAAACLVHMLLLPRSNRLTAAGNSGQPSGGASTH